MSLLTAYTGPVGAFLYVLGCREPLPGTHEQYVKVRWRQVLGSTMYCVAGDGVGILAGAVIGAIIHLPRLADIGLEYLLGFGFGCTIFQALFMRNMMGGSYKRALGSTFIPELLSMNWLMAGMVPVTAYPINWWLVSNHLKHGMMTIRSGGQGENPESQHEGGMQKMHAHSSAQHGGAHALGQSDGKSHSDAAVGLMAALSFLALAIGLGLAALLGGFR